VLWEEKRETEALTPGPAGVAAARRIVNETGYKRREREVAWLEGRVGQPQR
jgi:hypothetical protein